MKGMEDALRQIDWEKEFEGRSGVKTWEHFKAILKRETDRCIPMKKRRVGTKPVWMNKNVLRLIRKKRRMWKWYRREGGKDFESFQAYKNVQNLVQKAVRKAKRNFERRIAKEKNKKSFYSYMKKKTGNRVSVGPLKDGTEVVDDNKKMAEILNKWYCSVFTEEDFENMPLAEQLFDGNTPLETVIMTPEMILKKLRKLNPNSAPGPDGIWTRVVHTLAEVLCSPLDIIFTRCMEEGEVPPDWKTANVAPIYKKGSKGIPGNYWPVSLTCVLCKVMEMLICDAIVEHLIHHNLIRSSQHGFIKGKSTVTNLLAYLEELTKIVDGGHPLDVVYLDFAKAF